MEAFVKGDVVIMPFPFSNLSGSKRRPVLVVANADEQDIIVAQITSKEKKDKYAIPLAQKDFKSGTLQRESNVRINQLFTAEKNLIIYKAGDICKKSIQKVEKKIIELIKN